MKFDVAVVSHGTDFHLLHLLRSLAAAFPAGDFGTCHVWDNASRDATGTLLELLGAELPWLSVQRSALNLQHGPALDRLLRDHCRADWVLVLDSDTRVRRDFRPALPALAGEPPAFVGQIHPEPPQLYAYLCHLLLHRPRYLELPPFSRDGAPGLEFFRAVETRGLPWRRFRFCEHVEHYGQATLRGVFARGEAENELYAFAALESRRNPAWAAAAAREAELRRELAAFLAERGAAGASPPAPAGAAGPPPRPRCGPLGPRLKRRVAAWSRAALTAPRARALPLPAAALLHAARTIGLAHAPAALRPLLARVRALAPRRVLEIGTAHGGSFYLWTRTATADAALVSLGLPPWELDDPGEPARRAALAACAGPRQRVRVLRRDPLDPAAEAELAAALEGAPLDFLFVADAGPDARLREILARFAPRVRAGGLVAHASAETRGGVVIADAQRAAAPGSPGQ